MRTTGNLLRAADNPVEARSEPSWGDSTLAEVCAHFQGWEDQEYGSPPVRSAFLQLAWDPHAKGRPERKRVETRPCVAYVCEAVKQRTQSELPFTS